MADRRTYFCHYSLGFSGEDPCDWSGRADEMMDYEIHSNKRSRPFPVKVCPRCIEKRRKRGKDFDVYYCGWISYHTKYGFPGSK